MALFTHEDDEGDELEVMAALNDHRGQLVFNFNCRPNSQGVFVTHDRVAALHAALGEWLYAGELNSPPIAEDSLIDQLIVRRVRDEVARVLPLHQSPQTYVPEPDAEDGWERVPEEPKYEDARPRRQPDPFAQFVASVKAAQEVVSRLYSTTGEGAGTWGTDGTSPNGPVPLCQARGCGHEYAAHRDRGTSGMGCLSCPCVRYRSNG